MNRSLFISSLWLALTTHADAQVAKVTTVMCGPFEEARAALKDKVGEVPVYTGQSTNGKTIVQVYVSPEGTFTVMEIYPGGLSCVIAMGTDWEQGEAVKGEPL